MYFGTLAVGLGCFPFDNETYLHAAYAFGACVAPLAVLACHKLGGDNGWRLALEKIGRAHV